MRLTFGPFVFDSRARALSRDGKAVALSPKAFRLLTVLIEARPAVVSKEVLYDTLWPGTFVEIGNLHNLISELRRALGDEEHSIIRTVHGGGYSFEARNVGTERSQARYIVWIGNEVVHLHIGENIIGRDPEAAVVIESADVSRQHARLFVADDHVVIEDLGSKNGTFVGEEKLTAPRVVRDSADIVLGKTVIQLRKRGDTASTTSIG